METLEHVLGMKLLDRPSNTFYKMAVASGRRCGLRHSNTSKKHNYPLNVYLTKIFIQKGRSAALACHPVQEYTKSVHCCLQMFF